MRNIYRDHVVIRKDVTESEAQYVVFELDLLGDDGDQLRSFGTFREALNYVDDLVEGDSMDESTASTWECI